MQKEVTQQTEPSVLSNDMLLSMIPKKDLVQLAVKLNKYLEAEHNISREELCGLSDKFSVPISIFSHKLSPLEALAKFLKEERKMSYHDIGELVQRDERGIWITYRNAKRKQATPFQFPEHDITVPLKIFTKRFSILESLVRYLKEQQNIKVANIAHLLNKSTSTVWTVYNRAKRK